MNPGLVKGFTAEAAIGPRRFVKLGTADNLLDQADAATDIIIGVSNSIGAAINKPCDAIMGDIGEVVLGGTVTRGSDLTTDANGAAIAVAATVAAASNVNVGAIALQSGVSGDIIKALVFPKKIHIRS